MVHTDGAEETPVAVVIKSRLHVDDLHSRYGGCGRLVYIQNKNLQAVGMNMYTKNTGRGTK